MNNIEQSPSNGSLNIEAAPGSRRHSTESLIGTTNGEISNSSSANSIENKAPVISSPRNSVLVPSLAALAIDTSNSTNGTADSLQTTRLQTTASLLYKFAAVLRFATKRKLTHEHERWHDHEHDSDPHYQLLCSGQRRGDPLQRQHCTIDVVDSIVLGII